MVLRGDRRPCSPELKCQTLDQLRLSKTHATYTTCQTFHQLADMTHHSTNSIIIIFIYLPTKACRSDLDVTDKNPHLLHVLLRLRRCRRRSRQPWQWLTVSHAAPSWARHLGRGRRYRATAGPALLRPRPGGTPCAPSVTAGHGPRRARDRG
jgi:hypothetical protein